MEAYLDIWIPKLKLIQGMVEEKVSWGGKEYSQEPRMYTWGDYIRLEEGNPPPFLYKLIPDKYLKDNWEYYYIRGGYIDIMDQSMNFKENEWSNRETPIETFLSLLLEQYTEWIVIFDLPDIKPDLIFPNDPKQVARYIKYQFPWEVEAKSFIAISPNRRAAAVGG